MLWSMTCWWIVSLQRLHNFLFCIPLPILWGALAKELSSTYYVFPSTQNSALKKSALIQLMHRHENHIGYRASVHTWEWFIGAVSVLERSCAAAVVRACENIRFSSLFVAGDVSRGGTSAIQRQKFHTDDVKSFRNPVRSADWSTEQLHCLSYCLRMTDKRQKATMVNCKREESLTKQSIFLEYSLL